MALVLTGTEYVDLSAHGAALDIRTRPITAYAEIVTTTDDGQFRSIVVHGADSGSGVSEYELYLVEGSVESYWESDDSGFEAVGSAVDDGALHRVALDLSVDFDSLAIWQDGSFIDSDSLAGDEDTLDVGNDTRIGSHPGAANFIGEISNVAIWDRELTSTELEDLTDGTTDPGDYPSGLLGWWPLAADARDMSGNDRHGTPVNDPVFTEADDEVDAEPDVIAVTVTANNAMSGVGASADAATVSTVANNATVERAGNPDGTAATVGVAANDATVDAVGDSVEANAIAATVSVVANDGMQDVGVHAISATVAIAAQRATPTGESQVTAGRATANVTALNAGVTVSSEIVTANAQAAHVGVTANGVAPTGEANATATAATVGVAANSPSKSVTGIARVDVDAHGAQVAIDADEIGHAQHAEIAISAIDATVLISDNVTARPREARVSVTANDASTFIIQPPPPTYSFFPPTVNENLYQPEHPDAEFIQRLYWEKGESVVKKGGEFITVRYVVPDILDGQTEGIHYFVGGFHYSNIPKEVADELTAAGYEPELEEV